MDTNRIGSPKVESPLDDPTSPLEVKKEAPSSIHIIVNSTFSKTTSQSFQNPSLETHTFYFEQGERLLKGGQFEKAIRCFKNAVDKAPEKAEYWHFLGKAQSLCFQDNQAIESFLQATKIDPTNSSYWRHLGIEYLNLGNVSESSKAIEKAYENETNHLIVLHNLIHSVRNKKSLEQAVETFNFYTKDIFTDTQADYWSTLGSVFLIKDNEEACKIANQCFARAIGIDKTDVENWQNYAKTYSYCGKEEEAIKILLQITERFPNDLLTHLMLGEYYFKKNEHDVAIKHLEQCCPPPDMDEEILINDEVIATASFILGSIYENKKQLQLAITHFNQSADHNPYPQESYFQLGLIYMELRDYQKAVFEFEACVESKPNFVNYRWLGVARLRCNDFLQAKECFINALESAKKEDDVEVILIDEIKNILVRLDSHIKNSHQ